MLLGFSMTAVDKGVSVSEYVSRSLKIIDESGVDYRLNAMGTVLEGEWDEVMSVVTQCYDKMSADCKRITCSIKIDYREGPKGHQSAGDSSFLSSIGRDVGVHPEVARVVVRGGAHLGRS